MKHKVSDLAGVLLDTATAKSEGRLSEQVGHLLRAGQSFAGHPHFPNVPAGYVPSTSWAVGGPIIEREKMAADFLDGQWVVWVPAQAVGEQPPDARANGTSGTGPTLLIAAMRAYVASKFGDEIELP